MSSNRMWRRLGWAGAGLVGVAAVTAGAVQVPALSAVEPGQWELREIGGSSVRSLCVADPAKLIQVGAHEGATCTREVLESAAKAVTVHYSCNGTGNGRTTLTLRSPRSLKLETQGIAGGAPFAVDYDARRTGTCTVSARD